MMNQTTFLYNTVVEPRSMAFDPYAAQRKLAYEQWKVCRPPLVRWALALLGYQVC